MKWFFLALGCAFFISTYATLSKIILKKENERFVIWVVFLFSIPLFFIASLYRPMPSLGPSFWKTIAILLPLELAALLLYMKALKISPISLVFPFLGLTPVFTILTSFVILKEKLPLQGMAGVILVSLGAYLLNANKIKEGVLEPIKSIYKEKGSLLMILVALIFSLTSTFGKRAVLLSDPQVFPVVYYSIFLIVFTPIAYQSIKSTVKTINKKDIFLFFAAGLSFAIAILLHYKAISLANVSYMISVKRLSLIISVAYGAIIFKEKDIIYRLLGAGVMLAGVTVLLLA